MRTVNVKFSGLSLALVLAAMLVFAATAQAQTPAEDQYGSPTDPSGAGGTASAGDDPAGGDPGDPAGSDSAGASAESSSAEGSSGGDVTEDVVLPTTGGAPLYLALAGVILVGTSATLWLRLRTESR